MRKLSFTLLLASVVLLSSCGGGGVESQPANAEGFGAIETSLKEKFGANAYYTDLTVIYNASIGNSIATTVTDDPASLKMAEWTISSLGWNETAEVTLEIPEGTEAADYMFQLGDKVSLSKLGELIEDAKKKLTAEKDIANPALSMATIMWPDNGDISEAKYSIGLEPENGGTSFSFYYELNGDFIEMDY